jgi:hypothetical protein
VTFSNKEMLGRIIHDPNLDLQGMSSELGPLMMSIYLLNRMSKCGFTCKENPDRYPSIIIWCEKGGNSDF